MLTVFQYAAAISVAVGAALFAATQRHKRELRSRDGFLLVTLAWVFMSAIATVPLLIALPGLTFTDAFFETMSGLSTTGATVLTGLDSIAPSLNMWRATLHWFGGMGIIVLAVAILPLLGVGGMQLYKAETPGPLPLRKRLQATRRRRSRVRRARRRSRQPDQGDICRGLRDSPWNRDVARKTKPDPCPAFLFSGTPLPCSGSTRHYGAAGT